MAELSRDDFLHILEITLSSALRAVRSLQSTRPRSGAPPKPKGTSNIGVVRDLLKGAGHPLHIEDIIRQAKSRFGRTLSRESLVSALTKKVLDQHTFTRVAPNTFGLLSQELPR